MALEIIHRHDAGEDSRSIEPIKTPWGSAAVFHRKGPRRNEQRDALGLRVEDDGTLSFMVTDGITRNSPDAGEVASRIVETGMRTAARGNGVQARELTNEAYNQVWLKNHDGLDGEATCITGIIKANREIAMHLVGDPETADQKGDGKLTSYPHPTLVPQIRHFRELNDLLEKGADVEELWRMAQWESRDQVRANNGLQPTHFMGTSGNYKLRKPSATWTLAPNSWLIAGSDGLSLSVPAQNPDYQFMRQRRLRIETFLKYSTDPVEVAQYLSDWFDLRGPDNATGIVIRVD